MVAWDQQVAEGLKQGDPGAMTLLYGRYGRMLYALVNRIVGRNGETEEIVQDIFLRIWLRADSIDCACHADLRPWILTVARNAALDHLRASATRAALLEWQFDERPPMDHKDPEALFDFEHRLQRIRQTLTLLPGAQREVLELAYFDGMSQSEIAIRISRPLGTVKTWMRTGIQTLRLQAAKEVAGR